MFGALLGGGAAVAGATGLGALGYQSLKKGRENELLDTGPGRDGSFKNEIGPAMDQLYGIDAADLLERYHTEQKRDPTYKRYAGQKDFSELTPGQSADDWLVENAVARREYEDATDPTVKRANDAVIRQENRDAGAESWRRWSAGRQLDQTETAERNRVALIREGRLSDAQSRLDNLELRRDDLMFRQQQETNRMDTYRQQLANQRADKKQERMMALIQGLATLGSGFAL